MGSNRYKVSDDARVTLGHLELQLAFCQDHLENLRLSLFYLSKMKAFIFYSVPPSKERDDDIATLSNLHAELCGMQRKISIGTGGGREQWKENLARLAEIQFIAGSIAVKYDLVCYEIAQFSEFKS